MGLLYAIFSIFITLFFPKQITDVICYGRHRDRENIKSKKIYCLIYVFWTFFFGLFCLMMGSASGVNNTFDRVLDYYGLNFGEYDYFEARPYITSMIINMKVISLLYTISEKMKII